MADRVSQETVEVIYTTTGAKARVSQEAAEVLYKTGAARARVSQVAVEVLGKNFDSSGRGNKVSQVAVEVLWKPAGTVTITLSSSGVLSLASAGASPTVFLPDGGQARVVADDATVCPITVTSTSLQLVANDAGLMLQTPGSGVLALQGDAPRQAGPIPAANSGVLRLAADSPIIPSSYRPSSGRLSLAGDPITITLVGIPTGRIVLAGDRPIIAPTVPAAGRLQLQAAAPLIYPLTINSRGKLALFSSGEITASTGIRLATSGILRLRSDVPVVTPLKEPPPPPPPPLGGVGIAAAAVIW